LQDIKVLIIGAGVAGLTCANLLNQQGIHPLIIERESEEKFNTSGYMLGLLPLGGRVFNEMGLRDEYFDESIQMDYYNVHSSDGEMIRSYPLDFINEQYGSYRGISRMKLIEVLLKNTDQQQMMFGTTVKQLHPKENATEVVFSDDKTETFDVIIVADGIHSTTRKLILDESQYSYKDTGWGGWVTWLNEKPESAYDEYWGAGSFLGLYPVKDHVGVFLGGPVDTIKDKGLGPFIDEVAAELNPEYTLPHRALQAFDRDEHPFFWSFQDCRSETWHKGNVILLGDAATGFLPTAGVGASMAMDSASALVDELSRMDTNHIEYALHLYTQRQKERVERAQEDSRKFGRFMFVQSGLVSMLRDKIVCMYSLQRMLSDLSQVMEGK